MPIANAKNKRDDAIKCARVDKVPYKREEAIGAQLRLLEIKGIGKLPEKIWNQRVVISVQDCGQIFRINAFYDSLKTRVRRNGENVVFAYREARLLQIF